MRITLRLFASLREQLGISQESLEIPSDVRTIAELRAWLMLRGAVWEELLAEGRSVRAALNQEMVEQDCALVADAEVAFFPPVTGG